MSRKLKLNAVLEDALGSEHVYFQPPETIKLKYPCIIYSLSKADTKFADNKPYAYHKCYIVTVIDKNPDSEIPNKVAAMPMCSFDRFFTSDNLNHFVFNLYF